MPLPVGLVRYLEQAALLDDAVGGAAVGADGQLLADVDDLLPHALLAEVGQVQLLQLLSVDARDLGTEQNAAAALADALEDLEKIFQFYRLLGSVGLSAKRRE